MKLLSNLIFTRIYFKRCTNNLTSYNCVIVAKEIWHLWIPETLQHLALYKYFHIMETKKSVHYFEMNLHIYFDRWTRQLNYMLYYVTITLKETYSGIHIPYSVHNSCWLDYLDYFLIMTVQSCLQFMMPPLICIKYITWKKLIQNIQDIQIYFEIDFNIRKPILTKSQLIRHTPMNDA